MGKKKYEKDFGEVLWYGRRRRFGLPLSFTRYILTPTRLYKRLGFFNIKEEQLELYRVIDFSLRLPFGERIFGCGTMIIHSKDKTNPEVVLKSIKKPRPVMRLIEERVEQERIKYKIHGRDMIGAFGGDGDNCDC
ncbi:MAG: PH domain-containing protein [Oscillospiraceae bacterium]|nr:PH domain-containing protein [Oscillospiraceae bacterium]